MVDTFLDFYLGTGTDHRGRTLWQIVQKSDAWIEETHDYIQWLFPLSEPSQFNPHAPILTEASRAPLVDGAVQPSAHGSRSTKANSYGSPAANAICHATLT